MWIITLAKDRTLNTWFGTSFQPLVSAHSFRPWGVGTGHRYSDRMTDAAALIHLSVSHSILPSLTNQAPRYFNSSTYGRRPPRPRGRVPLFSKWEPWTRNRRRWFSFQLPHTRLQTAPEHTEIPEWSRQQLHIVWPLYRTPTGLRSNEH